jgi:glycerol-3-phosphate dehydrogenase
VSIDFDLAVVGGGINGTGIARDAAGRGLSVLLLEQGDLAGATSSASTKLIHGGLRYLEYHEFRMVREALAEREVLLRAAPHVIWPLRFVLPHHAGLRPWWMVRAGLFLYDHLGTLWGSGRLLRKTRVVDLRTDPTGVPLKPEFTAGFEYSDCWVDDARLVVLNARAAAELGADIRTRTACLSARRIDGIWSLALGSGEEVRARVLVNAAGPWVSHFLSGALGYHASTRVRMVKGSHIVVRRLFQHDRCYIFQNRDGRVCFAIPYERDFTLIGTTDSDFEGDPYAASVSPVEEAYLLSAVSSYLRVPVDPASIVWRYAGVRPLRDDGSDKAQEATRDYVLELDGAPPVLSVFGGKITTYRRLAEAAMAKLAPFFPNMRKPWTANARLPGGDFPWDGATALRDSLQRRYPFLAPTTIERFVRSYGTLTIEMLGDAASAADLGTVVGADLAEREIVWLMRTEWARSADDILWRRSKLGLRFDGTQRAKLEALVAKAGSSAAHSPGASIPRTA